MPLFEVQWEEDGKTVKAPGVSETEIKVCSHWYVARDFDQVWEAIKDIRHDPERRKCLVYVREMKVGLTILDNRELPMRPKAEMLNQRSPRAKRDRLSVSKNRRSQLGKSEKQT